MSGRAQPSGRREELAANLAVLRERVVRACGTTGRDPSEVTLVVVTKTFPVSDVRLLAELGLGDIGENRHQEAAAKVAECSDLAVRWHFVGQLQTNKAAVVARYASVVHSVDRPRLVSALARGAVAAERQVDCLVQVSLDDASDGGTAENAPVRDAAENAPDRGGAADPDVITVADRIAAEPSLRLAGVMAVAPRNVDPLVAFGRLADVAASVQMRYPAANWVSAGMSGDLEAAIVHGATHLRVGSAILGERPVRV